MPIAGTGIAPAAGGIFNELTSLTRRAYMRRLVVQLYYATPTLMMLLGGAQRAAGGVNPITAPVQLSSMVQGAWVGYTGAFNKPQVVPGSSAAQWNLSYFSVPVPLVLGEALLQSTEAIIPILDARMNDVRAVTVQQMSQALFTNNTANALMPSSFVDGFDNGANVATYGGINRNAAGNGKWKGQLYPNAGAVLTQNLMSQYSIQITDAAGGEMPKFAIMSPSDFATLSSSLQTKENIYVTPGAPYTTNLGTQIRSGFPNIIISGVTFFLDHFQPKGTITFVNQDYTNLYLSDDAPFVFSGFYSAIPVLQIAQIGIALCGYNVITTKPVANANITGVTGGAF